MDEQERWYADLGGHNPDYAPEEWRRARRVIAELIESTEDYRSYRSEPLTLLLDDSWHRAGVESRRARGFA